MRHSPPRAGLAVALGLMVAALGPAAAWAQPAPEATPTASDPSTETARRYFEAGVSAMERSNWSEAVNAFENSQRLRRTASVSLNLGISQHRLGNLLEARAALTDFMSSATPAQHGQHDPEVGRLIAEIGRRLGRIRLTELSPSASTVTIDGQAAVFNDAREVTVNPGPHRLRAEARGFVPHEESIEIGEGATRAVSLTLLPVAVVVAPPPVPVAPPPSPSIVTRWWFWTGIGLVAAGVTTAVVVAAQPSTPEPTVPTSTTGRVLQGIDGAVMSW